jgi:outer membrane protein assembly factor BamB
MKRTLPLLALLAWAAAADGGDWSNWRGPHQNGVSDERGLPDKFSANPKAPDSNVVWRTPSGGISTPIVQHGRVFIINKVGQDVTQQERVMCMDADSGKVVWEHKFNVFYTDIVRDRLGWTHLCGDPETGNVYAHGTQGFFICFDKDGKILWQHSLHEEYGRISGYGGRLASPFVDGDLVIIGMLNASWGEQTVGGSRFVAFDKRTGAVVWWASTGLRPLDTYYSCPVVAEINGERLLISGGGDGGVHAFKIGTGEKVWSYKFGNGGVNVSPVVDGTRVYIGHGEENEDTTQGRVICLDAGEVKDGQPKLVWHVEGIKAKFASPVLHEGRLYIPNEVGILYCLDAATGKQIWRHQYGKNTKGSPVWADGKIYITEVDSRFHILQDAGDECKELHEVFFRARGPAPVELNGSPAVANGRIYFLTSTDCYCIGHKERQGEANGAAEKAEPPADADKPAHLQVVPADVTLTPGDRVVFKEVRQSANGQVRRVPVQIPSGSTEFKVRAFDDKGRLIGDVEADWSLAGQLPPAFPIGMTPPRPAPGAPAPPVLKGELSTATGKSTRLTAAKMPPGQFGRVVARYKGLTGYARVRVAWVPPLKTDFSKVPEGRTPGGWVNTMGKFAVTKLPDGRVVLKKLNTNPSPLVSRAHAFIGLPEETGYTIEADVMGTQVRTDLPDIGIDANRYTLMLAGNTQQLRLVSWDALPRIDRTIQFPWKPGVWYSMKLTVKVNGDKATVRGKVWPRDEQEPSSWTVEVEDSVPNREGAPALYGYAAGILGPGEPGTDIYYDNVRVTPNK